MFLFYKNSKTMDESKHGSLSCFSVLKRLMKSGIISVDSRNFKKWGRSPTTTQNVGEGLKIVGDDFMMKFKLIKNTFSVYLDIFNWASIN